MNESWKRFFSNHMRVLALAGAAALALLTLFLLVKTVDALDRMGKSPYAGPNVITVTGTGKAQTPPTIARLVFTVQETAPTVAGAQELATSRTSAALDAIRALGIADDDVQAAGYNVNPQYDEPSPCYSGVPCTPGSNKVIGYQVSQTVTVKVRNTAAAGDVLQALGTAGVQNIAGPNFEVDDESEVMEEARGEAIEDARKNARALARQLGVGLGDVVSFNENGGPMPYYGYGKGGGVAMDARVEPASVPLPQGQNESVVTVTITYEIH